MDLCQADTDYGATSDRGAFSSHEAKTCKSTGNSPDPTPWGQLVERDSVNCVSTVYDIADSQAWGGAMFFCQGGEAALEVWSYVLFRAISQRGQSPEQVNICVCSAPVVKIS